MTRSVPQPLSHLDGLFSGYLKRKRLQMVIPFIPADSRILDVGCDDGALLDLLPAFSLYVGVDSREDPTRHSQKGVSQGNVSFVRADFPDFAWSGPAFDRIVLTAVLEHLDGLDPILIKLGALVKEGGLLLITTPAPISHAILKIGAIFRLFARDSLAEHKHYYRRSDFAGLAGWRIERFHRFECGLNQLIVLRRLAQAES